ncbi:hypothetical protein Afil01_43340 [Actinorhabdospora filicis]|uniref:Uncharacterized protein n=1 Tax=Actinorhabdospora filicis TaxID=1785913 RepID=A0A9W6SP59_9ACTN|nr:hypothetical protein [Actinorhabdospora filicis]GLZ79527.1 hypothetical protein Afil01_43340 [Actinorhabdospora filicis]
MSHQKVQGAHGGLTWTGIAALFLVLRMMAVVHWHWGTAFSVADTINLDDVLTMAVGTAMADEVISAAALLILFPILVVRLVRQRRQGERYSGSAAGLLILTAFAVAMVWSFAAWWLPPLVLLLTAGLYFLMRERHRNPGGRAARWLVAQVGAITLAVVLVGAAVIHDPWVSLERIDTAHGTLYGYVLDTPPGYLKVLTAGRRELVILETSAVTGREEVER